MDGDLLSFALNEAGLDEFFLSNSNDGFLDGQAAAANGAAPPAAASAAAAPQQQPAAAPTVFPPQQQLQQAPESQGMAILVPRSAPPVPASTTSQFGIDLLATAAAALNDDADDDPLMMLSTAATSSAPLSAPAVPSANAPFRVLTGSNNRTAPAADPAAQTTTTRATGGAESTLQQRQKPATAAATPAPVTTPTSAALRTPDGLLRPAAGSSSSLQKSGAASRVATAPRLSTPSRLSTPESLSRPGSAGPAAVRRVLVGSGGQVTTSRPSTPAAAVTPATPSAASAASATVPPSTPVVTSGGSNATPVTPAPPGQIIKKKVLLKRTMRGPNGPRTTQTHAIMHINDKGEKMYYTIPSPGGTSELITTVGAPGSAAATATVRPVHHAAQQQQQQQQQGEAEDGDGAPGRSAAAPAAGAAAAAAADSPHVIVRRRPPGEQPRRIVVVRPNSGPGAPGGSGGATAGGAQQQQLVRRTLHNSASTGDLERLGVSGAGGGFFAGGGGHLIRTPRGTVVRRVSTAGGGPTLLRQPQHQQQYGSLQRGGYMHRTSSLAGGVPSSMEQRYASVTPPPGAGHMMSGRLTVTGGGRPSSTMMTASGSGYRGGGARIMRYPGEAGMPAAAAPTGPPRAPGNTASYTTYQRSAYPRGGLHHHHQQHQQHHAAHGHQYGRGGSTMGSHRMPRGYAGQGGGLRPALSRQQQLQPGAMHAQTLAMQQQHHTGNLDAYSPMPRGLVGHHETSGASGSSSSAALDIRRRSMTPAAAAGSAGLGGGSSGSSKALASPAAAVLPKKMTSKEEMQRALQQAQAKAARNDIDDDEENLGHAETYADYKPAKLRSGQPHPDSVVETASLSSVAPPDVKYQINIPEYLIDQGAISALQLEAVIYSCQMHENLLPTGERLGYLIGDGAGVGKGRTVACIIFENYLLGRRRALWLSVSNDLRFDAERDLRDIGAGNIQVHSLNKMKYSKISGKENGTVKKGVMFATYSSLIGECRTAKRKYQSRLKQLIQWLGVDFDGCIVFDECHRAKNLVPSTGAKPTKTGQMVLELQRALPKARVVYASATGATEPRNMAYMTRLGLWGTGQAFVDFGEFINAVERRGVGAMEIVAMDMKQRGLYLARQLSFRGVNFTIQEVQLSDAFVGVYDESVKLWVEVRRQFQTALAQMDEEDRLTCKHIWGQFWASHQRFFKYLCIAAKVDACVKITRDSIAAGKCVVIGLQSTGESRTLEAIDDMGGELTEFVSTAKAVIGSLIDKHFPTAGDFQTDIFRDFDRMFDGGGEKRRRKRPTRADGMDVLEELGLGGPSTSRKGGGGRRDRDRAGGPRAKRIKRERGGGSDDDDDNSTTSSSGDDSSSEGDDDDLDGEEDDGLEDEEEEEDADDFKLGENEEDWLKALLAEAASSSEEEDGDDDSDVEKKIKKEEPDGEVAGPSSSSATASKVKVKKEEVDDDEYMDDDEGEDEFNPFACDFSRDDPWASKQQVVEDSPKKKIVDEEEEEKKRLLEERRRERRRLRKRKQRKMERKREKLAAEKKQREITSEAVKKTASDFMTSSRLCGDGDPESFNPQMVKAELLAAVERLGPSLPANTLDQLIDQLGGPDFVAEMTGRKGRIVQREDGEVEYELRHTGADVPLELMNMDEKDKFMKGDKCIAIISEAASSGISLQSDRRAPNVKRRVHITLELPWSADKAIQQFGRTHRSNQVSAPEYIFLISELAGEKRFASIVAKRLESLGALTHGDRRATESRDLSQFNFDTKYGRSALDVLLRSVIGTIRPPLIDPPADYKPGNFFQDMCVYLESVGVLSVPLGVDPSSQAASFAIERDASTIAKFLNRILGLPVHAQNALFAYFADILAELILQAKHDGTYDMGIMDLGTGGDQVRKLETRVFLGRRDKGSFRVEMHKIGVERGVSWEDAHAIWKEHNTGEDGFYVSSSSAAPAHMQRKKMAVLVYGIGKKRLDSGARLYAVTRPSTGRSAKLETFAELSKKFEKIADPEEAKVLWQEQYDGSNKQCQHAFVHGKCKNEASGVYCEVGRRTRTYFVLSGSVLSVWPVVEEVLSAGGRDRRSSRMQVIRVRTDNDQKIVGLLVLPQYVRTLVAQLEEHCGRCYVDNGDDKKKV